MNKIFKVVFNVENDAFTDNTDNEIARILREIASNIESGKTYNMFQNVKDINGNTIGTYVLKDAQYFN